MTSAQSSARPFGVRSQINLPGRGRDTVSTRVTGTGERSTRQVAADARAAVIREITRRGGTARQVPVGQRTEIRLTCPAGIRELRVVSKRKGDWQSSIRDGDTVATDGRRLWVFVDFGRPEPRYYVVPEREVVTGIRVRHQAYLARNGGRRVLNDSSLHCAIKVHDVASWAGRWDLLGLDGE